MDENEFTDGKLVQISIFFVCILNLAEASLNDLISEYQQISSTEPYDPVTDSLLD